MSAEQEQNKQENVLYQNDIIRKFHLRMQTVKYAKLFLLLFTLKPVLFKLVGDLHAGVTPDLTKYTTLNYVEMIIPCTLAMLWILTKKPLFGYWAAVIMTILLGVLFVNMADLAPALIFNVLVVWVCFNGAITDSDAQYIVRDYPKMMELYSEFKQNYKHVTK